MATAAVKALSPAEEVSPNSRTSTEILSASSQSIDGVTLIESLRQAVGSKSENVESIFKAVAAAAQILTKSDGVALAMRQNGRIICRARSGEMAPELGTTIDPDSGISGECVRAAAILMCHDTLEDKRVEAEVCRNMGIRSVVAVPLRGEMGMAGILEAFSSRPNAFDGDALNSLRALSQIAEMTYARERGEAWRAVPLSLKTQMRSAQIVVDDVIGPEYATKASGRVWIIATVAMAILTFSVAWWSWHHSADEMESVTQATHSSTPATTAPPPSTVVIPAIPKPTPSMPALPKAGTSLSSIGVRKILRKTAQESPAKNASFTALRPALPPSTGELVSVTDTSKGTN